MEEMKNKNNCFFNTNNNVYNNNLFFNFSNKNNIHKRNYNEFIDSNTNKIKNENEQKNFLYNIYPSKLKLDNNNNFINKFCIKQTSQINKFSSIDFSTNEIKELFFEIINSKKISEELKRNIINILEENFMEYGKNFHKYLFNEYNMCIDENVNLIHNKNKIKAKFFWIKFINSLKKLKTINNNNNSNIINIIDILDF